MDNKKTSFPVIVTDKSILRQITPDDAVSLVEYYKKSDMVRFLDWKGASTEEEAQTLISLWKKWFEDGKSIRFAISGKEDGAFLGMLFFTDFKGRRAEIGYELEPEYRGRGIATASIISACEYAFENLNLKRVQAIVSVNNKASQRALEKSGFLREGLLKNYETRSDMTAEDMYIYSKTK